MRSKSHGSLPASAWRGPRNRTANRTAIALFLLLALACSGQVSAPPGGEVVAGDPQRPGRPADPGSSTPAPGDPGAGGPLGPIVSAPGPSTRFARLNHQQWENTVRDLLRLPALTGLSTTFVAEPLRSSFDTNGGILNVSPDLWLDYQAAAENLARKVARDPRLLQAITPAGPPDPAGKARAFVEGFGQRAFRRPLTESELFRYLALFNQGPALIGSGEPFADGVELCLSAFLQSPHFLYRTETSTAVVGGKVALNDYEIASRVSYGLVGSMPDDTLLAAAGARRLQTRDGLLAEARRLLDSPAGQQTISTFHDQLLRMREYEAIKKDSRLTPLFPLGVGEDLKQETLAFVRDVVGQGRGFAELMTAPYTFVNSRLGRMYGLNLPAPPAGQPDPFVRVELDPGQRAGFLTQIGFLAANGEEQTPNIIIRGVRVAFDVLCLEIPPPPNAIPPLPAIAPNTTNRQRIHELTKNPPCSGCHATAINPLGYAFENLDGFGRYRNRDNGQPIDASGSYQLDGATVSFDGAIGLIQAMARSQQAHECYSRRWAEYVYGRELDMASEADRNLVSQAGLRSRANLSVKELLFHLIATDAFTSRLP
jgi:hypothetical protein